ncbi:MAG: NmrA family NAD(P)-binding protein [Gemmataceae bacterium]|nr:NmrA family NAD(P)-binding protein [Gemmataceae bacterium]
MNLLLLACLGTAGPPAERLPAAPDAEVWKALPRQDPVLPAWARSLVRPLPKATAAMLDLDHTQRALNPLGPALAAKVRWAVFDALGCGYGKQVAEADLRRAGAKEADIKALGGEPKEWPADDRPLLAFARKLTKAGYSVTDGEVEALVKQLGVPKTVALVHTVAYANFQTRVFAGLGLKPGDGEPPAAEITWDKEKLTKVPAPGRRPWPEVLAAKVPAAALTKPDWEPIPFDELEQTLEKQSARTSRIPVPDLGPQGGGSGRIVWSRVGMGYQPALTTAWFTAMRAHTAEAGMDKVFENSVFWVVTRTNDCFY